MIGIYKITCMGNGKVYVGQSIRIKQRWKEHQSDLKNNKHYNHYLQNAYNKYGKNSFKYEILEQCPKTKLNEREEFYIKLLDSYKNGFNCNTGGINFIGKDNPMYGKSGKESPRYVDNIYQLSLKGEIVKEFESANLAAKEVQGQAGHIVNCLQSWRAHRSSKTTDASRERFTHKGYYWIYKKDYEILQQVGYDFSQKRNKKSLTTSDLVNRGL